MNKPATQKKTLTWDQFMYMMDMMDFDCNSNVHVQCEHDEPYCTPENCPLWIKAQANA